MNQSDIELSIQNKALENWIIKSENEFLARFQLLDFYAADWQIGDLFNKTPWDQVDKTTAPKCLRIGFNASIKKFSAKNENFILALRCLATVFLLRLNKTDFKSYSIAFNTLASVPVNSVFELEASHLRAIERTLLSNSQAMPISVEAHIRTLRILEQTLLPELRKANVTPHLFFKKDPTVYNELKKIRGIHLASTDKRKNSPDRLARIAATSDVISASFRGDKRLNDFDHLICCSLVVLFTVPSRINEPINMSVDDVVSIESYLEKGDGELASIYTAQRQLFVAMKGSKGAEWAPKPALNFMYDLLSLSIKRIISYGKRSRMLLEHYEKNPNTLYLSERLKYLRDKDYWDYEDITRIVRLNPDTKYNDLTRPTTLIQKIISLNIEGMKKITRMNNPCHLIPREQAERYLLDLVHGAIRKCKKEGDRTIYKGNLSNRLFLCDVAINQLEFLPNVLRYSTLSRRLTQRKGPKTVTTGSIFQKLGLKVPSGTKIIDAYITTHEARHFLTDSARKYGDDLSDVLINKWARRLNIKQLDHYISDDPTFDAERSAMPNIDELVEFNDVTDAINQVSKKSSEVGVQTNLVKLHTSGVLVTSVESVANAVKDRPAARSSNKLIILYPSQFGICLHQHHETPCMSFGVECMGCNENLTIKGHIPSNDAVRSELQKLQKSVIRQLERLVTEHNRQIADNQDLFSEHMVKLVKGTLNAELLADQLIDEFHEVKALIKDMNLRRRLEQAFVAKHTVKFLDDERTLTGGVIKYHNPDRDGSPGIDKAELAHGGWDKAWDEEKSLETQFPFLMHTRIKNLKDQSDNFIDGVDEDAT